MSLEVLKYLIPPLSAILYLAGGQWWKPARWLMGFPIGFIASIGLPGIWVFYNTVLCGIAYWVATSCLPYGEKSWLNFLGEYGKFAVCGCVFGLSSVPVLGYMGCVQAAVAAIAFVILKYLDDKDIIKNPYQELGRGFFGSILYF